MKIGMNLLLWTGHVTSELYPLFGKLKAAGFDGVEIPLFEGDVAHYKTLSHAPYAFGAITVRMRSRLSAASGASSMTIAR